MDDQMKKPAIPSISAETEILCKRLSKLEPGESVSYEELSKLIAQDVTDGARHILASARRKAQNDHGVVTVPVKGEGVRRAKGAVYRDIVADARERIRNAASRALRKSLLMPDDEWQQLTPEERIATNTERTMCGTLAHFASTKVSRRLAAAPEMANGRMAIGTVLQLESKTGDR